MARKEQGRYDDTNMTLNKSIRRGRERVRDRERPGPSENQANTGPVPNGSDLKIVPDSRFVHKEPGNRTVNPFPNTFDL